MLNKIVVLNKCKVISL